MKGVDVNAEVAERVMGWKVVREMGCYLDLLTQGGAAPRLPDFVLSAQANEMLRQSMKGLGFGLTLTVNPGEPEKGLGQTVTACFRGHGGAFESTQTDEKLAVCIAALRAKGMDMP